MSAFVAPTPLTELGYASEFGTEGLGDGQFKEPFAVAVGAAGDIFALDLATRTGFAFGPVGASQPISGSVHFGSAGASHEAIFAAALTWATDQFRRQRPAVIVSNRGPLSFRRDDNGQLTARRGAGGLVSGLAPLVADTDAVWLAAALSEGDREAAAAGDLTEAEGLRVRFLALDAAADAHARILDRGVEGKIVLDCRM